MEITGYFRTTRIPVPKLITSLHCGKGLSSIDGYEVARIDVPYGCECENISSTTLIAQTAGDSMEPTLTHGDTIIINTKNVEPRDGDIVVAVCYSSHVVKRYRVIDGKTYLSSDNKEYPLIQMDDNVLIIGEVLHRIQKIQRELI